MASRGLDCVHGLAMDAKPDAHGVTHARTAMKTAPTQAAIVHFNINDFDTTSESGRAQAFFAFCVALDRAEQDLANENAALAECPTTALGVLALQETRAPIANAISHAGAAAKIDAANRALKVHPAAPNDLLAVGPTLQLVYPSHAARDPRDVTRALTLSEDARIAAESWCENPEAFDNAPIFRFQDHADDWRATKGGDGDIYLYGERTGIYLRGNPRRMRASRWIVMMTAR